MGTPMLSSIETAAILLAERRRSAVFLVGVEHRSGINFLSRVVRLYPEFELPAPLWEDHFLRNAHLLDGYVEKTVYRWRRWVDDSQAYQLELERRLGDTLLDFLYSRIQHRRLVVKSPGAHNLHLFHRLFPESRLVLLMRDGRDVVESAVRTFPQKDRRLWTRRWARGARWMAEFMAGEHRSERGSTWEFFKYEDFLSAPRETARRLVDFLELDEGRFDWPGLESMPLVGSSVYTGGEQQVHWDPVAKPADFRPGGRWQKWGALRRLEFKLLAGKWLVHYGYAGDWRW